MTRSNEDVLRFIAASVPSVWALELLLALRKDQRLWTRDQLVTALCASDAVVSNALEALVAAGLASAEGHQALYLPVSAEVEEWVERAEQLYRIRPNMVRRAIIAARTGDAAAFADAFRLRKRADD